MAAHDLARRVHGAVFGQAIGDALGAPTEGMPRAVIRATYGRVTGFVSDDPAGTDDTEYAALTAGLLLAHGHGLTEADVSATWRDVLGGQEGGFRGGGFSEMVAIHNLQRGLSAPASGSDNHETWSDGSAMRVVPIGAYCAGDPDEAARLAAIDASVSHSGDGVRCSQAVAAAVAVACVSDSWEAVVEAGLRAIPVDSWTSRAIRRAVETALAPGDADDRLDALEDVIAIRYYPWADVGPEATALAFGVFAVGRGDYVESVLHGVNIGRDADTIAAMAGAMAGGLRGVDAIPVEWRQQIAVLRGDCIAAVAGTDLAELADRLVAARAAA